MARAIASARVTPADELRQLLSASEDRVVSPEAGGGVPELFAWMDEIIRLLPELAAAGADVKAEQTRWQTLQAQVRRRGGQLLRAWPPPATLPEVRHTVQPDASHWWWWLDREVAGLRRRRLVRSTAVIAAALAVIILAVLLVNRLFPVDPQVREVQRLRFQIEQALASQDYATALDRLQQAVAIDPTDPALHVQLGVAAETLGQSGPAETAWTTARELLAQDQARFALLRGQAYLAFGRLDQALQDEQAAVALAPDLASAHYFLGLAHEMLGQRTEAVNAYSRAAELARDTDPQLVVLARTRLATLLQQPPSTAP